MTTIPLRDLAVGRRALPALAALVLALASPSAARAGTTGTADAVAGGILTTLGLGAICATGVIASEENDLSVEEQKYARQGFTVGGGAAFARNLFQGDLKGKLGRQLGMPVEVDTANSFGLKAGFGYRCHPRFAVESQAEWVSGFDSDVKAGAPSSKVGWDRFEPAVFTTNIKAFLLTGQIQPFLLVGAGGMTAKEQIKDQTVPSKTSEREKDFAMRFGVGLDYYWTENILLRVGTDYVHPFGSLDDFDYVSVGWGVEYRF